MPTNAKKMGLDDVSSVVPYPLCERIFHLSYTYMALECKLSRCGQLDIVL